MRKILALAAVATLVATTTASAITFGELDGNRHPNVGALVADWNPDSPGPDQFCTGTLVTSTLFTLLVLPSFYLQVHGWLERRQLRSPI